MEFCQITYDKAAAITIVIAAITIVNLVFTLYTPFA
jgi:hypothetical protein